jgi:hypothetical protein
MSKITALVFLMLMLCGDLFAQETPKRNGTAIDSLFELNLLMSLLDSVEKPKSFFDLSLGIGNKLFSQKNNSVNASQAQVNQLYYTPSIGYYHKTGLGISITPYLTNDNGVFKVYQTAISPSYNYSGKSISAILSYTHYFADNKTYNANSTFQNDLYASTRYKKWFLEPSIAIGYTTGKFNEVNPIYYDSARKVFNDSTKNSIKDFSISAGIEHSFEIEKLFIKNDELSITPQLILTAGSEKYTSTRVNKIINPVIIQFLQKIAAKKGRVLSRTKTGNTAFAIQSLALSLSADYSIRKFSISPNIYSDYYLPPTSEKRLNTVFSISLGYYF